MFERVVQIIDRIVGGDVGTDAGDVGVVFSNPLNCVEESTRRGIDQAIHEMDKHDPIVNAALDISVESAIYFSEPDRPIGFEIQSDDREVKRILESLCSKTRLREQTYDIMRSMLKYGNAFVEIVYDRNKASVARLKLFPYPYWIRRNEDEYGNLKSGSAAEAMRRGEAGIAAYDEFVDGHKYVASFDANQIAHFRHGATGGGAYAYPRLGAAISTWRIYRAIRNNVALRSTIGGMFTRIHHIPMPWNYSSEQQRQEINRYRQRFGSRATVSIDSTDSVSVAREPKIPVDVYVPMRLRPNGEPVSAKIEVIKYPEGDDDFDKLDIWINMVLTCLRVPPSYAFWNMRAAGSERSINVDKVDQQFARQVRRLQEDYKNGLKYIFDIELMLHGKAPNYEIVMPSVYTQGERDVARVRQTQAQALAVGIGAGIDPEWWAEYVLDIEDVPINAPSFNVDVPEEKRERGRPSAEEEE